MKYEKHKPYEGRIEDDDFKLNRIIDYAMNSFLPVIEGKIQRDSKGTIVHIRMRMMNVVLIYWILCMLFAIYLTFAFATMTEYPGFDPLALIGVGFLIFGYLLAFFSFKYESRKSIKDLAEYLEAEIER